MGRGLKYEIPGEESRVGADEITAKNVETLFAGTLVAPFPLVVEIGFGRGEFLLELASKEPGAGFLGVEVSFKRTLKMARKVAAARLCNVKLAEARGQVAVKSLAGKGVRDFWVNFSDPWPKARHAHRRLFQPEFVHDVAMALEPNGRLLVATDDRPYAEQIDEVLSAEPLLVNSFAPAPFSATADDRIQTGYEADWLAQRRALHFFEYARVGEPEIVRGGVALPGRPTPAAPPAATPAGPPAEARRT